MIQRSNVMPLLLAACPSYATSWAEYQADATFDANLLYTHLGDFAHHVLSLLREGRDAELHAAFVAVESLHVEGVPEVSEAATIGLLEGIQNCAKPDEAERFVPYLGPESLRWWRGLNAFWEGRAPAVLATDE
jgi:hypothetical protein